MKIKNLNIIEKHVEKLILALAVLFMLWVVWSYLLSGGVTVEVNGQEKKPADVEADIKKAADAAKRKVSGTELPPELRDVKPPDYISAFKKRLVTIGRTFRTEPHVFILGDHGLDPKDVEVKAPDAVPYINPDPPPMASLMTSQTYGVLLEPSDADMLRAFERLIGAEVPRDFRAVTVRGAFPLDEWKRRLQEPQPGRLPLREEFWREKLGLVDVVIERQSRRSSSDRWGRSEEVARLPHIKTVVDHQREGWIPKEALDAVKSVMRQQSQVLRPPFVPTDSGAWNIPGINIDDLPPEQAEAIRVKLAEVNALQAQMFVGRRGGGGAAPAPEPAPEATEQPSELGPPPGAGGTALPADAPPSARRAVAEGSGFGTGAGADGGGSKPAQPQNLDGRFDTRYSEMLSLIDAAQGGASNNTLDVWVHDITVQPGMQYRYRMQAYVLNPLFQRDKMVEEQHVRFFQKIALPTPWSDWSEPIEIEPEFEFYLVGGLPPRGGDGTATVEVYTIFNGRRMRQEFKVQPGDPIGGTRTIDVNGVPRTVDMRLDWVVVDLERIMGGGSGTGTTTTRMIVLDRSSGELDNRVLARDQKNPQRLQRQFDAQQAESAASARGIDDRTALRSGR